MTFAAMSGPAAWVLIAAAALLAAALFFIKLRPPRILVPSLSLWQRVLDASPDITRWERIRRAVSLVVTILIAAILALAVVRPSLTGRSAGSGYGTVLIVLDSSWSMRARTGSGETRWERALAEARRIAAASDRVALATTADGVVEGVTDDAVLIEAALGRLSPSGVEGAIWPAVAGSDAVHFITDGARVRSLDRAVVVHSVFEPAANVAITAFDVRPSIATDRRGSQSQVAEAYLEVGNFAAVPQQVRVVLARGNVPISDTRVQMAAGEAYRQVIPLARTGDALLRARIEAAQNALDVDDQSVAWIDRAQRLAVVVVGDHTEWLRRLLATDSDVRATFVVPADYRGPRREDVTIFDRWAPPAPSDRPALYVAPPLDTPWLSAGSGVKAADERRPRWETAAAHPVLRGVDPMTIRIEHARGYSSSDLLALALSARGTPLVSASQTAERRFVVLGFGPAESNLALAPGFPVFVGNALDWLARPEARAQSVKPGLVTFGTGTVKVTGPDGATVPLVRTEDGLTGTLSTPGLYVVEGGGARSTIAVSLADAAGSNVARTALPDAANATPPKRLLDRQWWVACAMAAFLLAFAEWWTWQRRITV